MPASTEPLSPSWRRTRPILRWTLLSLAATVALLLAVAAAWVLSNLRDAPAEPLPAALALPLPLAADADSENAAHVLAALLAAADRDPAVAGRADRMTQLAFWALPAAQRDLPAQQAAYRQDQAQTQGKRLAVPTGAPWYCDSPGGDCTAAWIAQADALARQRAASSVIGQRCEQLLDGPFRFEELLPTLISFAEPVATHVQGAVHCARWFRSGAALAWAQGRPDETLLQLARADKLLRGLMTGSQSLIAQMVALRVAHDTLASLAALALRDPALAVALLPRVAPLPDQHAAARRWMVFEAAFGRAAFAQMLGTCKSAASLASDPNWLGISTAWLSERLCDHRIGLQPERTQQRLTESWLQRMRLLDADWPAVLQPSAGGASASAGEEPSWWRQLTWRNTMGALLVDIAAPAYTDYLARHADIELQREAVAWVVALQAQRVPAAERAAWMQGQALSDPLRARLRWADEGRSLDITPWRAAPPKGGFDPQRDAIRFVWPG